VIIQRRSFLAGLGALFAAPAIVKASSLMVCAPTEIISPTAGNAYLTINQITRESILLFAQNNAFLRQLERQEARLTLDQYSEHIMRPALDRLESQIADELFPMDGAPVGTTLRIRLPKDFVARDAHSLLPKPSPSEMSVTEVAVIGTAAVIAKNPAVSRRFWSR